MQLFYCPEITEGTYALNEDEAKHCTIVLRKNIGDKISLINGKGTLYHCTIIDCSKKSCLVEINSTVTDFGKHNYNLHIAIAPTKNIDRIEWFLEKSTEIGINNISFLNCDHSERNIVKPERLEKVIVSAMKQSLKAFKPNITPIQNFNAFISQDFGTDQLFIAHCIENETNIHLKEIAEKNTEKEIIVLIGPEGDFSANEIKSALNKGFKAISLGNSRLRTETAALYATSIISLL